MSIFASFKRPTRKKELLEAILAGDVDRARGLLGLDHSLASARYEPDGFTPLHYAAYATPEYLHQGPMMIKMLIEQGADIAATTTDDFGATPLHFAANQREPDEMRALLECGADSNAKDKRGETPLHYLVTGNWDWWPQPRRSPFFQESISLLLSHGALTDAKSNRGDTPLQLAAKYIHDNTCTVFKLLVEKADDATATVSLTQAIQRAREDGEARIADGLCSLLKKRQQG